MSDAQKFFDKHKDDFVTEYATTNPVEDFAESFMYYVIEEPIVGDSTKAQKIKFFNQFKSVQDYRNNTQNTIANWSQ